MTDVIEIHDTTYNFYIDKGGHIFYYYETNPRYIKSVKCYGSGMIERIKYYHKNHPEHLSKVVFYRNGNIDYIQYYQNNNPEYINKVKFYNKGDIVEYYYKTHPRYKKKKIWYYDGDKSISEIHYYANHPKYKKRTEIYHKGDITHIHYHQHKKICIFNKKKKIKSIEYPYNNKEYNYIENYGNTKRYDLNEYSLLITKLPKDLNKLIIDFVNSFQYNNDEIEDISDYDDDLLHDLLHGLPTVNE